MDVDLAAGSAQGTNNLYYIEMGALSAIENGRCNEGVQKFAKLGQLIEDAKSDFQPTYAGQELIVPKFPVYVSKSIPLARKIVVHGDVLPPTMCEDMRQELATQFKKEYGWVE